MTKLERILLETVRERVLALAHYRATGEVVKQAEASNNKANMAYQAACHMHSEAMSAIEATILDGENPT